jgi:hypothetical protein
MGGSRTWFEQYLAESMNDPEFAHEYQKARAQIDGIDALIRELDEERGPQD